MVGVKATLMGNCRSARSVSCCLAASRQIHILSAILGALGFSGEVGSKLPIESGQAGAAQTAILGVSSPSRGADVICVDLPTRVASVVASFSKGVARVTSRADGSAALVWFADGSYLLRTVDGSRVSEQYEGGSVTDGAIAVDGERLALSKHVGRLRDANDIWVGNADGAGDPLQVTNMPGLQHYPTWTPKGDLLFLSGTGGRSHDIWFVKIGEEPRPLLTNHGYCFDPAMSVLGDLAFSSDKLGGYDIWLLRSGRPAPELLVGSTAHDAEPTFSPDGKWIAYIRSDPRGSELRVHELDTGVDTAIPVGREVRSPIWVRGRCKDHALAF